MPVANDKLLPVKQESGLNPLEQYHSILADMQYLLQKQDFPIYKQPNETDPQEIPFVWRMESQQKPVATGHQKIRQARPGPEQINFTCKLCPGKLSGIRSFQHRGRVPVLVLHYTSEIRKGKPPFSKRNREQIFRSAEAEDLFSRMLKKVFALPLRDFHYQEYPACNFSANFSSIDDWHKRINLCGQHVRQRIETEGIKGVFLVGTSAVLYFGKEKAKEMLDNTTLFDFAGLQVPGIVLRSPEAILQLEGRKKKYAHQKTSTAYRQAKQEETEIKKNIVSQLNRFKLELGL